MYWEITINMIECVYFGLLLVCIIHVVIVFSCVPESGEEFTPRKALVLFISLFTFLVSLSALAIVYEVA